MDYLKDVKWKSLLSSFSSFNNAYFFSDQKKRVIPLMWTLDFCVKVK